MKKTLKSRAWVVRDESGNLYVFGIRPVKRKSETAGGGYWYCESGGSDPFRKIMEEDDIFGDEVKWEDEEPLEIVFCDTIEYRKPEKEGK